jgi:endonuclease YncB( thermonuclease family)
MKKLILTLLLIFSISFSQAGELILPVISVYDGDTIKTSFTLPPPLDKVSIRIYGIDTPEMPAKSYFVTGKLGRAKCIKEALLALEAKYYVQNLVKQGGNTIHVLSPSWDKYGGRVLGDVYVVGSSGERINIANALIFNGYAVEYYGKTKTKNWCE